MITNQLKENIIQWWLLHVIRSFLQVGLRLQHQFINLAWISFDICSSPLTAFLWFHTHEMSFYYNFPIFSTHFAVSLFLFVQLQNVVMTHIQFSLIIIIIIIKKIGRSVHLLTHHPPTIASHFCLTPTSPHSGSTTP